ncbi:conserved hypothetical protein [Micrococcus sp. 116]|nr:conserved hypothetical protein [Micrococcus sp. 116]
MTSSRWAAVDCTASSCPGSASPCWPCCSSARRRTSAMSRPLTWSSSCSSAVPGRAPAWENTSTPPRKAMSVGMEVMPAIAASCCWSSVSTLANTTSSCFSEAASNTGANWRHGPHQPAQKSTSTVSFSATVEPNSSRVRSLVATVGPFVSGADALTPAIVLPTTTDAPRHLFRPTPLSFGKRRRVPALSFGKRAPSTHCRGRDGSRRRRFLD